MTDVPETQPERSDLRYHKLAMRSRRTDDDRWCTLLVVQEDDGSWTVRGPGTVGGRLTAPDMVALAEAILTLHRTRGVWGGTS